MTARIIIFSCLILLGAVTVAPARAATPEAGVTPASSSGDVDALLSETTETMAGLSSFHFLLTTPEGKTVIFDNFEVSKVEGDYVAPNMFKGVVSVGNQLLSIDLTVVGIGNRLWIANPLADNKLTPIDASGLGDLPAFIDPDWLVNAALAALQEPQITGTEELNGVQTTKVEGKVNIAGLLAQGTPTIASEALPALLPTTLWIDDQNRVVQIEIAGPLASFESDAGRLLRRLELSAFNEPITIEEPNS